MYSPASHSGIPVILQMQGLFHLTISSLLVSKPSQEFPIANKYTTDILITRKRKIRSDENITNIMIHEITQRFPTLQRYALINQNKRDVLN